jgi:hypothetical protein
MSEGWVNAVITIVVPLDDVTVDDGKYAKQDAASAVVARLMDAMPTDLMPTYSATWEDVEEEDD